MLTHALRQLLVWLIFGVRQNEIVAHRTLIKMKEHYFLYLIGSLLLISNMRILFCDDPVALTRTSLASDGLIGVVLLSCAFIFGRQNREISQLRAIIERLQKNQVDLYSEAIKKNQNEK